MTSIEWLRQELWEQFKFSFSDNILEQAKEMHKQEIIDAYVKGREEHYLDWYPEKHSEEYYQETFVSKGSDKHIVDTNEMIELPQQETLYTEEQVREAIYMARLRAEHIFWYNDDEIIQSLKQPKKD